MRVVVLADTHAPRRWKACPPPVAAQLRGLTSILHAGDVCTAGVLDELSGYAPVCAVLGNNDGPDVAAWGAPPTLEFDLDGLRVAMIHDSGAATGRLRPDAPPVPRSWPGGVRPLAHSARSGGRGHPHLQPRLAYRPAPAAAWHRRGAADRGRPASSRRGSSRSAERIPAGRAIAPIPASPGWRQHQDRERRQRDHGGGGLPVRGSPMASIIPRLPTPLPP